MKRSERLHRSGIPNNISDGFVPIGEWTDIMGLLTPYSFQPTELDVFTDRINELLPYLNIPKGVPTNLGFSWYIDKNTSLEEVLLQGPVDNRYHLLPVVRYFWSEKMRPEFLRRLEGMNISSVMESLLALGKLGIKKSEMPVFLKLPKHHRTRTRYFVMAILERKGVDCIWLCVGPETSNLRRYFREGLFEVDL